MRIGIAVNISLGHRTGVEEYIYHLLSNFPMFDDYKNHQFFLLAPSATCLPAGKVEGFPTKILKWPFKYGWTQIRLSWEMLKNKPDVLFVPVHTYPLIYPALIHRCRVHPKLIITIQGLEFERLPKLYPFFKRLFLHWMTKRNAKKANKIIVPSENTKNDLIKYYPDAFKGVGASKIFVVHHGAGNPEAAFDAVDINEFGRYILYLGRSDRRKNINGLIKAFRILKQKYNIPHKLILAGPNIGYPVTRDIENDVIFTGYVADSRKWHLLKNAEVFVSPSFYEGFGITVLEAQRVGTPVVASSTSSFPEVLGDPRKGGASSALLINPYHPSEIAEAIHKIINHPELADDLIKRGYENVQRFSWPKCAEETLKVITS
jgi:glycosyltransferase involved in cell wall biosynthesis